MAKSREHNLSPEEVQNLWEQFTADPASDIKKRIIMQYIGLVRYVINNLNLAPNNILTDDDFVQIGILGLNESIERFDLTRGIKFETYAIPRIRGVILDEVRRVDWLSRTARKRSQEYLQAADKLRSEEGREISSEEIQKKLNLTGDEYKSYLRAAAAATSSLSLGDSHTIEDSDEQPIDILENVEDEDAENALVRMTEDERTDFIEAYLTKLPERQRLVMSLYYFKDLTFKEIGVLLKITESRVCQIHTSIVNDLRKKIEKL